MRRQLVFLCLAWMAIVAGESFAKRAEPRPVPPVVHHGVKYAAPNQNGREGKVEARDEKTGRKLWEVVIYTVAIDRNLEEDVQWVFITALSIRDDVLTVTNEKGERFSLDLKTKKVERLKKDEKKKP